MACAVIAVGGFFVVRGQGWGAAVGVMVLCTGFLSLALGIIWVRAARCVVEVDFDRAEFRLHHFVYPLGFWDIRRKPLVTVPFGEVRGVSIHATKGGRAAYVGTRSSRFELSDSMQHFDRVLDLAEELAGPEGNAAMRRASALRIWVPALISLTIAGGLVYLLASLLGWI